MQKKYTHTLYLFFALLSFTSCRLNDPKEWDMQAAAPIAHTELSISDIYKDTALKQNPDKSLKLVKVTTLKALQLGDYIKVPDTMLQKSVSLKTINLGTKVLQRNITLGEVARNSGFTGLLILASQGKKTSIPPLNNISTGATDINAENFFQTATFIDGKLQLDIHNGFPVDLTDIHFKLSNKSDGATVVEDQINSIPAGSDFSRVYSLAGKTVEGKLVANIISMNSPGSNGNLVLVDTSNALGIRISAYNMQVFSAQAIFPAQNLVNDQVNIPYNLGGPLLTFMKIKTGTIKIRTAHTIQDSLYLRYTIPGATLAGVPLDLPRVVPPAPPGDTAFKSEDYKVDGYDVDLTGKDKDTFNTFFNTLTVRIDSTGKMEKLSLADSIYIFYGLFDVVPAYARGYLGQNTYKIGPETLQFDYLKNILAGDITLADVKVNLQISNGIGAEGNLKIISIKAINSKTGASRALSGSILSSPIHVNPALDNPFRPSVSTISLDPANSNIKDLLQIIPDHFEYEMEVQINPNGNTSHYNDFFYYESAITADLNVEIPLELGIHGLTLVDTMDVNFNSNTDINRVKDGTLNILAENGFPFDAKVQIYTLSTDGRIMDSLLTNNSADLILAGPLDAGSQKVLLSASSRLAATLDETRWQQLLQTRKLIVRARLDTKPANQNVKIYSNYKLKLKFTADFRYRNSF
jgi:hypothetical protein